MPAHLVETFPGQQSLVTDSAESRSDSADRALALLWQNALVAGSYWGLAALVKWYFSSYQMWPAPLWLPAGVALFAAVAVGRWSWPGIFLGALLTDTISLPRAAGLGCLLFVRKYDRSPAGRGNDAGSHDARRAVLPGDGRHLHVLRRHSWTERFQPPICATAICARAYAPLNVLLDKWFDWMLSDAGAAFC